MVGRAEFAYLIAQLAASSGMMGQDVFSVVVWSLLYATVFAPLAFRKILERFSRDKEIGPDATEAQKLKWNEEHNFNDFRQSGHLPIITDDEDNACHGCGNQLAADAQFCLHCGMKRHEAGQRHPSVSQEAKHDDHAGHRAELPNEHEQFIDRSANKPVSSERYSFDEDAHNDHDKFGVHSAPHGANNDQFDKVKEALDVGNGPGARGSGFLCCLFFRKIIIM